LGKGPSKRRKRQQKSKKRKKGVAGMFLLVPCQFFFSLGCHARIDFFLTDPHYCMTQLSGLSPVKQALALVLENGEADGEEWRRSSTRTARGRDRDREVEREP
jgi:hypothetical protein